MLRQQELDKKNQRLHNAVPNVIAMAARPLNDEEQKSAKLIDSKGDQDAHFNELIVPVQNGSSTEIDKVSDHSSDDEIQMDDLGEEFTANIVRATLKNNSDTQYEANLTDRLSKENNEGSVNEFYHH